MKVTRYGNEYEWRDGTWWTVSNQPEPFTADWEMDLLGLDPDGPDNAEQLDQKEAAARGEIFGHPVVARRDPDDEHPGGWRNLGWVSYSDRGALKPSKQESVIRFYETGDEIRIRRSWWPGRCRVVWNGQRMRGPGTHGGLVEVENRMLLQAGELRAGEHLEIVRASQGRIIRLSIDQGRITSEDR